MIQVTLISLYGNKNSNFETLIKECQQLVTSTVGTAFTPYDIRQIHATIIGLEQRTGSSLCNANFAKYRGRDVVMDFDGFLSYLRQCGQIPFEVQLGGFSNRDYPFTSRGTTPYERSFSIQGDKVVVMGWPVRGKPLVAPPATPAVWTQEARIYPTTLDVIRHAAQGFGILHGYHQDLTDVDNDLFFRIGLIDPRSLTPATQNDLEDQIRKFLGAPRSPSIVEICPDDICIAAYEDDRLPLNSTQAWSLANPKVTGKFVNSLFR